MVAVSTGGHNWFSHASNFNFWTSDQALQASDTVLSMEIDRRNAGTMMMLTQIRDATVFAWHERSWRMSSTR